MVFIHTIDNNILNYGALVSRVYQKNENARALTRDKHFFGLEPNPQNTDKTVVHVSPSTLGFLKLDH